MLKVLITFFFLSTMLSSCANDPNGFLKRSANNKLFDTKGFHGGKRAPLYNKKYITQAKKNILKGDYEIDDDYDNDEAENISRENIEMYKALIKKDLEENYKKNKRSKNKKKSFLSLINSKQNTETEEHFLNLELKDELEQVKLILEDTRKELENNAKHCTVPNKNKSKQSQTLELESNLDKLNNKKLINAKYQNKFQPKINEDKNISNPQETEHEHVQSL